MTSNRAFLFLLALLALVPARAVADDALSRMDAMLSPGNAASVEMSAEPATDSAPGVAVDGARGSAIVARHGDDVWSVSGRAQRTALTQSPVISAGGLAFPDRLWNLQAGGAFRRTVGERRSWGVSAGVGSASDKPFHSIHETQVQATAHLSLPSGERNMWALFLAYSNNRTFANNVPLPGFAYFYRDPSSGVNFVVGFPFVAATYVPAPDWTMRASLFGPTTRSLEVERRLIDGLRAYANVSHGAASWFRANRETVSNRLFYEESRATVGARAALPAHLHLDISAGRSFDRRFFEARNATSADILHTKVGNAWILGADLSGRWGGANGGGR